MFGILDAGVDYVLGEEQAEDSRHHAEQMQERAFAENQKDRDWQERMANTRYQRGTEDLRAAGLNPMLAYMNSAAPQPSGHGGNAGSTPLAHPVRSNITAGMQTASQIKLNDAVEDRTKAEAERARAEAKEIEARTPTHSVNIDRMRQEINESVERMQEIGARITVHGTTAAHQEQQVRNLQEELPRIRALTNQLQALTGLNKAQAIEAGARTTVSDATYDEIRQRTKANLPELEKALKELEAAAAKLSMPGRGMDAAANDSFLGAWRAAIRALSGQQSILGR